MADKDDDKKLHTADDPAYQEFLRREMESFEGVADNLNATIAHRRKMFEPAFRMHVLPLVRGQVRNEKVDPGVWLQSAGGMTREIEVIDQNSHKTLFICPPAFVNTDNSNEFSDKREFDPGALIMQGNDFKENGEIRFQMEADRKLDKALTFDPVHTEKFEAVLKLIEIYHFYKLPMEELLGEDAEKILDSIRNYDVANPGSSEEKAATDENSSTDSGDGSSFSF